MDNVFQEVEKRMKKSLEALSSELATLRTGRASLSILDEIRIDYYGQKSPLNQVATLSVPDPRTITIQPWDTTIIGDIERAIQGSGLGLTPMNDGKLVRITIPSLNEERRRELVKVIKRHGEECKVSVRNVRRDANEQLKKLHKESKITEDDVRKGQDRIQKMTDDSIKKIETAVENKEKDIMAV